MKYLVDILSEIFIWCHQTIAAPTLLTAEFIQPNVELAWTDNADNDECWMIWRSVDGTNFTLIETVHTESLESYSDTTAAAGVLYYYKVQACNEAGDTSDFSNTVQVTNTLTAIKYGMLYNKFAIDDLRGITPAGWHIPIQTEIATLTAALGGWMAAGGELKEIGIYWLAPNIGATNSTGFTARGAGWRIGTNGAYNNITSFFRLHSADIYILGNYYGMQLDRSNTWLSTILVDADTEKEGRSIRYIKDDSVNPGTVADYDGNIYPCVTIGTQVWTAANAVVTHYNNGDDIPYEADAGTWSGLVTGARCLYNNSWAYY